MRSAFALLLTLVLAGPAVAATVDATQAEDAYQAGDYKAARAAFEAAVEQFRTASKDSNDFRVYREAAYLYDRLADCCFTQRDWDSLKLYLDGLLVVSVSERNLVDSQLTGALESGIAYATARYLVERVDESIRLTSIVQLKRSLGLVLFEDGGTGARAEKAIEQYQALAAALRGVLQLHDGRYVLDIDALERDIERFDAVFDALDTMGDIDALWEKHPPAGGDAAAGENGAAEG